MHLLAWCVIVSNRLSMHWIFYPIMLIRVSQLEVGDVSVRGSMSVKDISAEACHEVGFWG